MGHGLVDVVARYPYLIRIGAYEQKVEGNGRNEVDDEPALEVVDGDSPRVGDDLIGGVHVRGPKVDEDIHDERNVHCKSKK